MPVVNLTKQFLKTLSCPASSKKVDYFDSSCKGLLLEVRVSGGRTYYLRFTDERGRNRQLKSGDARDISLGQAKQLADKTRNQIAMGQDPAVDKAVHRQMPTVYAFIHDSYLPFVQGYKRSWKCDQGLLRKHIEPIWGKRYLDQITKPDVIALMAKHRTTHAPGSCNRLLILLRYLFSCSLKWEVPAIKNNPTAGIPLMKEENQKER